MAASVVRAVVKNASIMNDAVLLAKHQASPLYNLTQVMYMRNKHHDPRFRQRRKEKRMFMSKEDYDFSRELKDVPFKEERKKLQQRHKRSEVDPTRGFMARHMTVLESPTTFDPYIPPEGDGKHSLLKLEGVKDVSEKIKKKALARVQAIRRIRKNGEPNFDRKEIAGDLQEIYIEAHKALTDLKKNKNRLHDLCTMNAYDMMTHNLDRQTLKWEFVESIEPPKVVHVTCEELFVKEIYMAQVTVRLHTKQKLALYDQFGRLMYGSPHLERDVLDFVVFEKNIIDLYGRWRLHDKITPEWFPEVHKHTSMRILKGETTTKSRMLSPKEVKRT